MPSSHARLLLWALPVIPIAFVFRVRANQEYLLLAGLFVAVYGVERARTGAAWSVVAVLGALFALLVKGVFGVLAPVMAALWLWTRRSRAGVGTGGWFALAVLAALPLLTAWIYEQAYVAATGQSFVGYYLGSRIGLDSGGTLPFPLDKAANGIWYAGRVRLVCSAVERRRAARACQRQAGRASVRHARVDALCAAGIGGNDRACRRTRHQGRSLCFPGLLPRRLGRHPVRERALAPGLGPVRTIGPLLAMGTCCRLVHSGGGPDRVPVTGAGGTDSD